MRYCSSCTVKRLGAFKVFISYSFVHILTFKLISKRLEQIVVFFLSFKLGRWFIFSR